MDSIIQAARERAERQMSGKKYESQETEDKLDQVIKTQEFILQEIKELRRIIMELKNKDKIEEF